jgi:DUF4097 and DUF4098 domain-containing protein YvlB
MSEAGSDFDVER